MMKLKRICALLLTLVLAIGLLPSALAADISEYGERPFREGLKPALVDETWNYINEQGQVVDLNQGRFLYVFDFFEGLAAVIDHDFMTGYIDKTGKLVIPCQYGYVSCMGMVYTGYFKNGVATVFEDAAAYDILCEDSYNVDISGGKQYTISYVGQIDKTGKQTKPFVSQHLNVYGLNLLSDAGYMPDAAPTIPETDYSFQVTRYVPALYVDNGEGDFLLDTGASYQIEFVNNTASPLKHDLAFVSYGRKLHDDPWAGPKLNAQIHYISLDIAANGKQTVDISSEFNNLSGGAYAFATVDFEDSADKAAFRAFVPMITNSDRAIDPGDKGVQWMKAILGITVQ